MHDEKPLDFDSAARYLRLGRSTLFRYLATGNGPRSVKTGPGVADRRVFPRAALDVWLAERSGRPVSSR